MAPPLIFISHSTGGDPEVVEDLACRLREAGFEPWLDRAWLGVGDEWRKEIDEALEFCSGAVIVVSPAALDSAWVKHEASILTHRRRMDEAFVLVPMLVDGTTVGDLRQRGWRPSALESFQTAVTEAEPSSLQNVVAAFEGLRRHGTAGESEERLENLLVQRLTAAGPGALRTAATKLGIRPTWRIELQTAVARRLLQVPIELQYDALAVIADIDAELALHVYELVAPHSWISAASAEQVRTVARGPAGERGLGINTALTLTCAMHVRCGFHEWQACEVPSPTSDQEVDELVSGARLALLTWLRVDLESDDVPCDRKINNLIAAAPDILPFLVLPLEAALSPALDIVHERWPNAPVLLRYGGEPLSGRQLGCLTMLEPPIDTEEEARIVPLYESHCTVFNLRVRSRA